MADIKIYSARDFPKYLPKLNLLYDELLSGGKGFRAHLVQKLGMALVLPPPLIQLLAQTVEFIHNSSLLHDDLVDRSVLRRGKSAAWVKYGPEYAVLAGDYLLARVMVNLSSHGNLELIKVTAERISDLVEGEWIQDSLVGDVNVALSQLDQVHKLKTASLFRWCLSAPFIGEGSSPKELIAALDEIGMLMGLLFQRGDDLLDYDVRNTEGKLVLSDLRANYVNSVTAFLFEDVSVDRRRLLMNVQSLEEFKSKYGVDAFETKIREFDQINQDHVDLVEHKLIHLLSTVDVKWSKALKALQGLAQKLYLRHE